MTYIPPACRLYLITPPRIDDVAGFAETLKGALGGGDVASLQIRLKDADGTPAPDDHVKRVIEACLPLAHEHGVAVLANDRPDIARDTGCDGVHIGQEDATYADARKAVGKTGIVGVTCHASKHLAFAAAEAGADYVAFGAFFPTTTKNPKASADIGIIEDWSLMSEVACVAIGGITVDNCATLVEAGADFVAVSAGVWQHPEGPAAAVAAFNRIFGEWKGITD